MEPNLIFSKYKNCILNANGAFGYYEKYRHCFSIRSVDEEMQLTYRKISITYTKLLQMVKTGNLINNVTEAEFTRMIDENEKLLKEKSIFFMKVISFLEKNEKLIIITLGRITNLKAIETDLDNLDTNLTYANKLVRRMENMLKASQQIYRQHEYQALKIA
ncbi:hypothetical protein GCM10023149_42710 [Mucilaginibacter gynuensis]|uniref:Uncharacterized protein n=1 Tax=Mucilaginibacter gynuensis TaxID=1302236 RepID=A0ABP8H6D7_9SPHI